MGTEIKRADFSGEFIVKEEAVTRPVVTVLRDKDCFARGEKDLIICGVCGSLNNYKKKYCGECGAKFKRINLEEAKKMDAQIKSEEHGVTTDDLPDSKGQIDLEDWMKESEE